MRAPVGPDDRVLAHDAGTGELTLARASTPAGKCSISRETAGRWRAAIHVVTLGPWALAPGERDPGAVVRAALRAVVADANPWHEIVLDTTGVGPRAVDAAWRYATALGLSCTVTPERDGAHVVRIWGSGAKARLRRAAASFGASGEERQGMDQHGPGTRYFVLDGPPESGWEPVPLAQVPENRLYSGGCFSTMQPREMESAVRRGDRCFALLRDGTPLFHMWTSTDPAHLARLIPRWVALPPFLYVYDCYTAEIARGQGLYGRALLTLARDVASSGCPLVLRVSPGNTASVRGVLRAGFLERHAAAQR